MPVLHEIFQSGRVPTESLINRLREESRVREFLGLDQSHIHAKAARPNSLPLDPLRNFEAVDPQLKRCSGTCRDQVAVGHLIGVDEQEILSRRNPSAGSTR
jgi:hypothetical protein